jgi:hypothetical protein
VRICAIIISRLQWDNLCYFSTTLDYYFICYQDWWLEKSSRQWYSHILYFFTKQIRFLCNDCQTRRNTLWRDVLGGCPVWRWWFLQQSGFAESLMCVSWCCDVRHHVCLQANTALLLAHMLRGVGLCLFQLVGKHGAQSWERSFSPQLRSSAAIRGPRFNCPVHNYLWPEPVLSQLNPVDAISFLVATIVISFRYAQTSQMCTVRFCVFLSPSVSMV